MRWLELGRPLWWGLAWLGCGAVVAFVLRQRGAGGAALAVFLWPFFVPALLPDGAAEEAGSASASPRQIAVQRELAALREALERVDGGEVAGGPLTALAERLRSRVDRIAAAEALQERWRREGRVGDPMEELGRWLDRARPQLDLSLEQLAGWTGQLELLAVTGTQQGEQLVEQLSALSAAIEACTEVPANVLEARPVRPSLSARGGRSATTSEVPPCPG